MGSPGYHPKRVNTRPRRWTLAHGHLSLDCRDGAFDGACPACLSLHLTLTAKPVHSVEDYACGDGGR